MSKLKRWEIFLLGTLCQAVGIALVVKSSLGTSPISSVPYVFSLVAPLSFGQTTFVVNMIFLLVQIILLRRRFQKVQLLQIPATIIFAALIDVAMFAFNPLVPQNYFFKLVILGIGMNFVSLGVALQVVANVLMLAGEAFVTAISIVSKIKFDHVKTAFDCALVLIAVVWSYSALGVVEGVREGTLLSALFTGTIAGFFMPRVKKVFCR